MLWAHPVMTVTQSGLGLLVSGSSAQLPRALNRLPESLVPSTHLHGRGIQKNRFQIMDKALISFKCKFESRVIVLHTTLPGIFFALVLKGYKQMLRASFEDLEAV